MKSIRTFKSQIPGGGGTLIFSHIRRLGLFFFGGGGFKILNFNIFGVFRKMNILGGGGV